MISSYGSELDRVDSTLASATWIFSKKNDAMLAAAAAVAATGTVRDLPMVKCLRDRDLWLVAMARLVCTV